MGGPRQEPERSICSLVPIQGTRWRENASFGQDLASHSTALWQRPIGDASEQATVRRDSTTLRRRGRPCASEPLHDGLERGCIEMVTHLLADGGKQNYGSRTRADAARQVTFAGGRVPRRAIRVTCSLFLTRRYGRPYSHTPDIE